MRTDCMASFFLTCSPFFSDNQIYSWGRGDNGRLGVLTDSLARAKGGIPCTAVPRPIFGALHVMSCVACRHWNSLIVAGKYETIHDILLKTNLL